MTRTKIGIGVGLGLGALALGGIMYKAADNQRRREGQDLDKRLDTWDAEGGAPPPSTAKSAAPASRRRRAW